MREPGRARSAMRRGEKRVLLGEPSGQQSIHLALLIVHGPGERRRALSSYARTFGPTTNVLPRPAYR
jgi:hypothetical protein